MEKIKWLDEAIERAKEAAWLGDHDKALEWLLPLLYEEPGYGKLHLALAEILHQHVEDLKLAESHYRHAIQFDPSLVAAYEGLTDILCDDERHAETIRICKGGLGHCRKGRPLLLKTMGKALELKERYRKAIRFYRKALRQSAQLWDCVVLEEAINRCKRKKDSK